MICQLKFQKNFNIISLIDDFLEERGHLFTKTNPVRDRREYLPKLDMNNFNLTEEDLNTVFQAGNEDGLLPCNFRRNNISFKLCIVNQ